MRWTRNARDNMLPAPLFQSTFAHGGKVGEGSSGHQCWLPLHSGSIPPPASHYLADREPLEPHLDELQPRGGGGFCCPPAGGNKTLFAGFHYRRRSTLSPLTHHRHQELEKLLKLLRLNLIVRQKRSLSKILLTHHVYSPLGCIYQTFKNIISIKICIFL